MYDGDVGGWVCGDAPGGGADGVVFGEETLTVGTRDEGDAYASLDTPLSVPDNVVTGVTSARFVTDDITIRTLSLDLDVDHPEPSQLTVTLTSPAGTSLTVVDGPTTTLTEIGGNFGWDNEIEGGNLYTFFVESTAGVWTLQVVDGSAGSTGSLTSWKLRFNQSWTGTAFVGAEIATPGRVVANEVVIANGGSLILANEDGLPVRSFNNAVGDTGLEFACIDFANSCSGIGCRTSVSCPSGYIWMNAGGNTQSCYAGTCGSCSSCTARIRCCRLE